MHITCPKHGTSRSLPDLPARPAVREAILRAATVIGSGSLYVPATALPGYAGKPCSCDTRTACLSRSELVADLHPGTGVARILATLGRYPRGALNHIPIPAKATGANASAQGYLKTLPGQPAQARWILTFGQDDHVQLATTDSDVRLTSALVEYAEHTGLGGLHALRQAASTSTAADLLALLRALQDSLAPDGC